MKGTDPSEFYIIEKPTEENNQNEITQRNRKSSKRLKVTQNQRSSGFPKKRSSSIVVANNNNHQTTAANLNLNRIVLYKKGHFVQPAGSFFIIEISTNQDAALFVAAFDIQSNQSVLMRQNPE